MTDTCVAQRHYYPDLLDVGAEELVTGLENGAWTSVDLTKVHFVSCLLKLSTFTDETRRIFSGFKKSMISFT